MDFEGGLLHHFNEIWNFNFKTDSFTYFSMYKPVINNSYSLAMYNKAKWFYVFRFDKK